MNLYEVISETYPELKLEDFKDSVIRLEDDGDGISYIAKWEYSKPIPAGLKLGK
jgi:hypothetical protein